MAVPVVPSGIESAVGVLRGPLSELGFKKRAGKVFTAELTDDALGWLGLNSASRHRQPGEVEVNPVVGVRHQDVERTLAELRSVKFHTYQPPTISVPLGYLMPQRRYVAWVFGENSTKEEAADFVAAFADHAVSFMHSHIELPAIRTAMEQGLGHQLEYRLPIVLALLGDETAARVALSRSLAAIGKRGDVAAQRFRQFAEAFTEWKPRLPSCER